MIFNSTRDKNLQVTGSQAILEGLASDGGLYVPQDFPVLGQNWDELKNYSYQEMAYYVLSAFLDDFSESDLQDAIHQAYDDSFDREIIAPLKKVDQGHYYLELFHGPTLAFKDMALSILPYLMKKAAEINGNDNEIIILTATSGDTGKAAMAGFADVPGTKIIVFYPKDGVSSIQERQMVTQKGDNTFVVGVEGNFDDAQTKVKELFNDKVLRQQLNEEGKQLSSANSMNIGRLLPQIVYYFFAYAQLIKEGEIKPGDRIDFTVPTGNFGNILAAYYAKKLGLPIDTLICASNDNRVLYDFFKTGTYDRNRDFIVTSSPSMDILISSNFERLLYHALDDDSATLIQLMAELDQTGAYHVPDQYKENFADFKAAFATETEVEDEISNIYQAYDYIIDPHTAVASRSWRKLVDTGEVKNQNIIVSTASPFKFPHAVLEAFGLHTEDQEDADLLALLQAKMKIEYPAGIIELKHAPVRHQLVIEVADMKETVISLIK